MENGDFLEVDGYLFAHQEDARIALQEQKKIEYLEQNLDFDKPELVFSVYRRAIEERIFKTPVGMEYLRRIYRYLKAQRIKEEIPPITLYVAFEPMPPQQYRTNSEMPPKTVKKTETVNKNGLRVSIILNLILAVVVIWMFVIAFQSKQPNILNYERALTDKYSAWETELSQREQEVREKERTLQLSGE